MTTLISKNTILAISIAIFVYFAGLISISHFHIQTGVFWGAVVNLFTIPLILLTFGIGIYTCRQWIQEKWRIASASFGAFSFAVLTITLMILATIYNI